MKSVLVFLSLTCLCMGVAGAEVKWPNHTSNCVRWVAQKRMFLVKELEVVGHNCSIQVEVTIPHNRTESTQTQTSNTIEATVDPSRSVSVIIPLNRFDSGEPERDLTVTKLLGSQRAPNIKVQTSVIDPQQWLGLSKGTLKALDGTMTINNVPHPITMSLRYDTTHIYGSVHTRFSTLKLQPPTVAGGAIAKVRQALRLEFKLTRTALSSATPPSE